MSITGKVRTIISADCIDYEVIEVYSSKESDSSLFIQVFIERKDLQPTTIDDCVYVSKYLNEKLQDEKENYRLEISSPGINRLLTQPKHFLRFINYDVKIVLKKPVLGNQLKYKGNIINANEKEVVLYLKDIDEEINIEYNHIRKANLIKYKESEG